MEVGSKEIVALQALNTIPFVIEDLRSLVHEITSAVKGAKLEHRRGKKKRRNSQRMSEVGRIFPDSDPCRMNS